MGDVKPVVKQTCEDFVGAAGGQNFEKAYRCVMCGLTFKESDTVVGKGKRYGVPCGCSGDLRGSK